MNDKTIITRRTVRVRILMLDELREHARDAGAETELLGFETITSGLLRPRTRSYAYVQLTAKTALSSLFVNTAARLLAGQS